MDDALAFLQNALMAKPDFPLAIALQSNLLVEQGNLKEAAASLNPACGRASGQRRTPELRRASRVGPEKRQIRRSLSSTRSLALKPDYLDAVRQPRDRLEFAGPSFTKLSPNSRKSLQAEPQNLKAQANLAAALFDLRRYSEASQRLRPSRRTFSPGPGSPHKSRPRSRKSRKARTGKKGLRRSAIPQAVAAPKSPSKSQTEPIASPPLPWEFSPACFTPRRPTRIFVLSQGPKSLVCEVCRWWA